MGGDMLVLGGFQDVGYDTIIIDDCWLDLHRTADGALQPNHDNFPSGVAAMGDYLHKLGLNFGLYEDYGNFTCGGYPGVLQNMERDAKQFADWLSSVWCLPQQDRAPHGLLLFLACLPNRKAPKLPGNCRALQPLEKL